MDYLKETNYMKGFLPYAQRITQISLQSERRSAINVCLHHTAIGEPDGAVNSTDKSVSGRNPRSCSLRRIPP